MRDLAPPAAALEVPADKVVADLTLHEADQTAETTTDVVAIAPQWPAQALPAVLRLRASTAAKVLNAHSKTGPLLASR